MSDPALVRIPEALTRLIEIAENGCWLWTGYITGQGYGRIYGYPTPHAHRLFYSLCIGPIPEGLVIDHVCHGPGCAGGPTCLHRRCVNPAHLEAVTPSENSKRMPLSNNPSVRKNTCPKGHPYDDENTERSSRTKGATSTYRRCRICHRNNSLATYRRRGALATDDPRHGTPNGYFNWRCRCDECRRAGAEEAKVQRDKKKAVFSGPILSTYARNSNENHS